MSFDPRLFHEFALTIQKNCKSEAEYRAIINRTYYAAFGVGRKLAGIITDGASVHQETSRALKVFSNASAQKAGKVLEELFKKRKKADYTYNLEIKKFESDQCILDAEQFFTYIAEFESSENEKS